MTVIAVIGRKNSGKTTTIEALVKGLTKRGCRVATIKHVSEPSFTMDVEGKDTWRHAQAGAQTVVVVAPGELGFIKKVDTTNLSLQEIIRNCQNDTDMVVLEGFRNLVEHEPTVLKIVAIKTFEEAVEASKRFKPIIAFTSSAVLTAKRLSIPVVDVLKEPEKLVEIVERKIRL
ncbi:MAG: molybdopterin-guanine dinucleotide biosynthesis protein B [Candidatus Bathyarchaeota archaeon]|nr:molybdopterin-guanine dinucleotide biosynthesis protein B [Candidatus Bathyarchaeota archaeon]MDH5494402.1 molybdopterin-guanine dinucleotide biosynthesis protein B [Candidatus Bathyarchaeota archaeon]